MLNLNTLLSTAMYKKTQLDHLLRTTSLSQIFNPNVSVSVASCLDHSVFLLPNLWLCSQHIGCCEHRGLPKYNTGLPATTGEKPWVFRSCWVKSTMLLLPHLHFGFYFTKGITYTDFWLILILWFPCSLITSPTKRRSLLSVMCAWFLLCLPSSAAFSPSR